MPGCARSITSITGRNVSLRPSPLKYSAATTPTSSWAVSLPAAYLASASLMERADDIVRNREHHDREDEQHAHLGQPQTKLRRERPAANPFRDEKHRVPAVEHGNRQEVEHRQAPGEKREEPEKHDETEPRRLTRHARDGNRAADLFDGCASGDESSDAGHHDTDLVRRLPRDRKSTRLN